MCSLSIVKPKNVLFENLSKSYPDDSSTYKEMTRRLSVEEKSALEEKLKTLPKKEEHILALIQALESQNWDASILHNADYPYYALEALKRGNDLSPTQFATLQLFWQGTQSYGHHAMRTIFLFNPDGSINQEARSLIRETLHLVGVHYQLIELVDGISLMELAKTVRDDNDLLEKVKEYLDKINTTYLLSEGQIDLLFEKLRALPKSEQQFFIVPDKEGKYLPILEDQLLGRSTTHTITQEINFATGLNVFSRLEGPAVMIPSFGLMQAYLEVRNGQDAVQMNPVLGLSSLGDLRQNALEGKRDFALHHPAASLPNTADNFSAPGVDFEKHDFYHAQLSSSIPPFYKRLFIQCADMIENQVHQERGFLSFNRESMQHLHDRFIDMEVSNFRLEMRRGRTLNDLFWGQIYNQFAINEVLAPAMMDPEKAEGLSIDFARQLPFQKEIMDGPKGALATVQKTIDLQLEQLYKIRETGFLTSGIDAQIDALQQARNKNLLTTMGDVWERRLQFREVLKGIERTKA